MNRLFYVGCFILLLGACKPGIPENVIQPDKMAKVLVDIHVADGYLATIPTSDSVKKVAATFYTAIYKKHGIDSARYNKSLDYYYKEPEAFRDIYKEVIAVLEVQKKKYTPKVVE